MFKRNQKETKTEKRNKTKQNKTKTKIYIKSLKETQKKLKRNKKQ